jgi:hypothetical protein
MNDLRTHTHSNGLESEFEAFEKASKSANSIKLQILYEMNIAGALKGLTPDEFVEMHGGLINTVRRRFTDLWKEGKIFHHPRLLTRKNNADNACVAWVLGCDPLPTKKRAKREWVGLTDEERMALFETAGGLFAYAKDIEARLKDKNT